MHLATQPPPARGFLALFRSLRTRLTLAFLGFFSVMMIASGVFFRESLERVVRAQAQDMLVDEWNTVRMYLRVEGGRVEWKHNPNVPEEAYAVERARRIFLLADGEGRPLEVSNGYRALAGNDASAIRQALLHEKPQTLERWDGHGQPYFVRMGRFTAGGQQYFLAVGLPVSAADLAVGRSVRIYFLILPFTLLLVAVAGWFLAGHALQPMNKVVEASEIVSGDNLSLRITPPGTGDELDHLVHRFNEMMNRLESSFDQIRQFTVNASHELRTPVTAVRGQLEVAMLTARTVEDYRSAIETAMQDVERLSHIVRTLLFLTEADSGGLVLKRSLQNVSEVVHDVVDQLQLSAEAKQLRLEKDALEVCLANIDRSQVERMLIQLISNGLQHTPAGGRVVVGLTDVGEEIELTVSDDGPGIPAQHLPNIFQRFYRVRDGERSSEKGLGLGLSVVAWVVKAHGGEIRVETAAGRGACFVVRLPKVLGLEPQGWPDSARGVRSSRE